VRETASQPELRVGVRPSTFRLRIPRCARLRLRRVSGYTQIVSGDRARFRQSAPDSETGFGSASQWARVPPEKTVDLPIPIRPRSALALHDGGAPWLTSGSDGLKTSKTEAVAMLSLEIGDGEFSSCSADRSRQDERTPRAGLERPIRPRRIAARRHAAPPADA